MRFTFTLTVALLLLPVHLRAQTAAPPTVRPAPATVGHKDPVTATVLGVLLPGGGQMYAGRTGKGIALLALSTGAVVSGAALSRKGTCSVFVPDPASSIYITECTDRKVGPLHAGIGMAVASWLYGAFTAPGDARAANEAAQRHASATPMIEQRHGRTDLGLAYRF
jgi:hypothetical protein